MKILNLANFNVWDFGYGKGRVSTYLSLMGFIARGHNVWWLTNLKPTEADEDKKLCQDGIEVVRFSVPPVPSRLSGLAFVVFSFISGYKLARRIKPDLIYAHQPICAYSAFLLSRIFRIPCIVRVYGVFSKIYFGGRIAFRVPVNLWLLTNDGTSGDKVALSLGVPTEKIAFLVNGIDKDLPLKADVSFRSKLAPKNEKVVLFVGRLSSHDQPDLLVKAVPAVIKQCPNTLFVIVGAGPDEENLINLCGELGIAQFVKFTGAVPHSEIASYMCASDIFVSVNKESNLSNSAIEAMCCGRAIIALNTGTTYELVKHGETGLLLEPTEIDKLPNYILELLNNDSLRESLGTKAREFILKNWPSWEERVATEVEMAENLVKHHRG